jgi:tryptophan 6-halogenase
MKQIKDIVIVGGGTAGLTTALTLKKTFPHYNITLIKSPKIKIIGVGEGSTEHWKTFMEYVDIDHIKLINETDATVKIGILFNNWSSLNSTYCHSILSNPSLSDFYTLDFYNSYVLDKNPDPYILSKNFSKVFLQNKVFIDHNLHTTNQYHFDTLKLNKYLSKKCLERNINIETAHIDQVTLNSKGDIDSLTSSDNTTFKGDLFIDCSGFKRLLSSKLNSKWISYKEYLPTNQAITLSTDLDLKKGIEPYTTATALKNGWTWKIPTQTRYGNGYVFSNDYINSDNALNELNQHLGVNVEKFAKNITFEAGKIDKFWIKNCISIGLSGSFTEPLEAQSIGFSIIQTNILCQFLNSWIFDSSVSEKYNEKLNKIFNNIVDYLQIHYFTKRNDSLFWKDKPFKLTDFNKSTYSRFSYGVFNPMDFPTDQSLMFSHFNFYQVYYGLGIINYKNISQSHQQLPYYHQTTIQNQFILDKSNQPPPLISHIEYLDLIRKNNIF